MGLFVAMVVLLSPSVSAQSTANTPVIEVAAWELVAAYNLNEVGADDRFKGRVVSVSGLVSKIGKDLLDNPYVTFNGSINPSDEKINVWREVQCSLASAAISDATKLSPGSRVTMQGTVAGLMGNVQMNGCTFAQTRAEAAMDDFRKTPDAAVNSVRALATALITLDTSDEAIRQRIVEHDRSIIALRNQIETRINLRYPVSMRDAKLREALASEYDPIVEKKFAEERNRRDGKVVEPIDNLQGFRCNPISLFVPGSRVVSVESGGADLLGRAIVFADIEYPDSALKISNRASSEFKLEGWYWLRKTIARFVMNDGMLAGCDLVDVQVYGRAPTPSAYVRYGTVSRLADIKLRFLKTVSSETAAIGDVLELEVSESLTTNARDVIIATGAVVKASIVAIQKPGRGGRPAAIALQIDSIQTAAGESLTIDQQFEQVANSSQTAEDLGVAGILVRGKHAVIPAGAQLAVRLKADQKVRLPE